MKKLLTAASALGLVLGLSSLAGTTVASATVRPHQTITLTVSKTTGLSTTKATTLTVTLSGASKGDLTEAGICNEDASQPNPETDPTDACTTPVLKTATSAGTAKFKLKLTPGDQGSDALSGCPQSTSQYGLGISCIVAAEDITTGATADVSLYFAPSKKQESVIGTTSTSGIPVLTVETGFEVIGLWGSSPSTLTGDCQPFSSNTSYAAWTSAPLCDDGANAPAGVGGPYPSGYGFALGEEVEVSCATCPSADQTGYTEAAAYSPAPLSPDYPGGVSYTFPDALSAGTYSVVLTGIGYSGANASGVSVTLTVKVSKTGKVT